MPIFLESCSHILFFEPTVAFSLFDFDKNGTYEFGEWQAFCRGSLELAKVQKTLVHFFDFVDTNSDGSIQPEELDEALNELSHPSLTMEEKKIIARISHDPNEFRVDDMIVFVSAEILKKVVREFLTKKYGMSVF